MKKPMNRLALTIGAAMIALTLIACGPTTTPQGSNPAPTGTVITYDPNPAPTYAHKPVGMAVPNPNPQPGQEGNYYFVRLITRVYDVYNNEAIGFNSPQVHFFLDVETATGQPATVWDTFAKKFTQAPADWYNYPPINDEQHLQELTQYPNGSWHGVLSATWTLTVTLDPSWRITCDLIDVGSGLTVSHDEVRNSLGSSTKGTVHCTWPYDAKVEIPKQG
jgi:hypothetical protein